MAAGSRKTGPPSRGAAPAGAAASARAIAFTTAGTIAVAVATAIAIGVGGWVASDALERNDDFCNACHDHAGQPLHREIRRDRDSRPPVSLAAAHSLEAERDPTQPFRCIDCHGGVGLLGRVRVKALAARDAFWWLLGRFEEPQQMRHPLRDADCRQCHSGFEPKGDAFGAPAFHDLAVHDVALGVDCVECHFVHRSGGRPDAYFLRSADVRRQCARCHSEFE